MSKCYIVEYTYNPDHDIDHVCDDAFVDLAILKQFMLGEAEDALDTYDDIDSDEYVMNVSWQEDDYVVNDDTNLYVNIVRNGIPLEGWSAKALHLNTQSGE